jgi:calcineurin-like phosphoesterase family protein
VSRVLIAGDSHGNTGYLRTMIDRAVKHGADRIFQLGDMGYWEHEPSGVKFLNQVDAYAAKKGVTVYFLDGNHDKTSLLLKKYNMHDNDGFIMVRPNIRYAPRGHRWTWDKVRFAAFGGAYSVDKQWRLDLEKQRRRPESVWFPEEEMSDEDLDGFLTDTSLVDVLLAHDKPRASAPKWNRKDVAGCWPNQDRIQRAAATLRPAWLFHGHLHYRYSDVIQLAGDVWCRVEGLDADPEAAMGVSRTDSWVVLPLDVPVERVSVASDAA